MSTRHRNSAQGAASQLIREIRAGHGFDKDQSPQDPAVLGLRGKLERALERLSNDLYNKKTHFLLEFIQNADDNSYGDHTIPTLRLRIEDRLVVFECNELGFSPANVKAICDIGASTKTREKNPRGFIGEKGIGFKSVFTVADQVHISSGPYSFRFDKTAPLGMITPVLDTEHPAVHGWTTFHLHLAPSENGNDLSAQLRDVRPTLLLFLRQLRTLSITIPGVVPRSSVSIEMRRTDDDARNMVSLEHIQHGSHSAERYILVKHLAQTPVGELGREDIKESEIVLAFPVTKTGEPVTEKQDVHAFLPLRCYGFKFIIQADFITSASREDILADKPWNEALRGSVIDAFLLAIDRFESDPSLRNVWFRYLPEFISDSFFCFIEHKLLAELEERQILRSADGTQHRASQLFILPLSYRDDLGSPLIPETCLPRAQRYLSSDYDTLSDVQVLRRLGVREMTFDVFLAGLAIMDQENKFGEQSDAWHNAVAMILLLRIPAGTIHPGVLPLRILPLHNGSWAPVALASTLMFPPGVSIPDKLGLQSIVPGIRTSSPRYQLFIRLGVMPPDPVLIARKILSVQGPRSIAARVADARFFFDHRRIPNMPAAMRLRLVDERGMTAQGDELYLDLPGVDGALSLIDALMPSARFLHPDYLSAYPESTSDETEEDGVESTNDHAFEDTRGSWLDWLRDYVRVNVVPRVLNGHLMPDFLDRAPALKGRELLVSLRAWWPRLAPPLIEAGMKGLGAISIAGRRLDTLYLRRGVLARVSETLELPCIPVDDPEDRSWDFLELLGVVTRMNASFFVNKLVHLQARGEKDSKAVEEIYKQLDARFDEDETLIKNAFRDYPIILVSVNDEAERIWLRKIDVYWHGPPSMRSKAVISRSYPHLSDFFFNKLGIPHAPPYALVDELRIIAERYGNSVVPQEVREHVTEILVDISEAVQRLANIQSFSMLAQIAVFPTQVPKGGIALRPADEFYVPDRSSKYADVFRNRVELLDLPDESLARVRPLLESDILKDKIRYLDSHVTKKSLPQGRRVLDSEATELYSSRVEYIARLVLHNSSKSDIPPEQSKILAKLHRITVISVEAIKTTLFLGSCRETTPEDVTFEEMDDKFTLFVSRTGNPGKSTKPSICLALSRLLGIPMMTLFTCISSPVDVVSHLFEFEGIAEIPVDDGHDRSWLQAIMKPNVPIVPTSAAPERSPSPVPPPSTPPRAPADLSVEDTEHFPALGARPPNTLRLAPSLSSSSVPQSPSNGRQRQRSSTRSSHGISEHSQFMQSSRTPYNSGPSQPAGPANAIRDMGRLAALSEAFVNGNQVVPSSLSGQVWPPFGNFNTPVPSDETDMVGIMGEHFVYRLLVRILDDFGPDNWTSELRHLVPGFTRFEGDAFADFTYLDSQGTLTRTWYGPEKAATLQGRWPKYHIEVKSTRGDENEPFHMSRVQMATAFAFSARPEPGGDMYVIMRVSRIGTPEPLHMVYADPHRAMFFGYLQCAGDVYLQRTTNAF